MDKFHALIPMELTPQERRLIEYIRKLEYGRMEVTIKNGKPVSGQNIRQSIVFDD